jgi:hypothetical protein
MKMRCNIISIATLTLSLDIFIFQVFNVATLVIKSHLKSRDQKTDECYYYKQFSFHYCVPPAEKQSRPSPELSRVPTLNVIT